MKRNRIILGFSIIPILAFILTFDADVLPAKAFRNASTSPIQFHNSSLYGPYVGGESITFIWSYSNVSNNNYNQVNDYITISCPSYSSLPLISKRVARHTLNAGASQQCSYSYTIPSARFNTESGIIIKVGVQYSGSYIALLEKTIKPISKNNINPLNYRSSPYVIKERSFYFNETVVEESFLFDEYRDYVECDEYYRLLFANLTFKYHYPTSLTYQSARIKFMDKYNLYPLINKDGDGYTSVDITLRNYDDKVAIEVNNLFYNPVSLETNDKGSGNKSRYLFVPKGRGKQISEYEFIIEVNEIGINKTSFTHSLETSVSPFFLGNCEDADYCVIGGVRA